METEPVTSVKRSSLNFNPETIHFEFVPITQDQYFRINVENTVKKFWLQNCDWTKWSSDTLKENVSLVVLNGLEESFQSNLPDISGEFRTFSLAIFLENLLSFKSQQLLAYSLTNRLPQEKNLRSAALYLTKWPSLAEEILDAEIGSLEASENIFFNGLHFTAATPLTDPKFLSLFLTSKENSKEKQITVECLSFIMPKPENFFTSKVASLILKYLFSVAMVEEVIFLFSEAIAAGFLFEGIKISNLSHSIKKVRYVPYFCTAQIFKVLEEVRSKEMKTALVIWTYDVSFEILVI